MSRPGFESSFEGVGNLRAEMESKLQGKADSYEIHSLNSKISSLESTIREIRSEINGICSRLQILEDNKVIY
jgi:predicted  nucleic acid-binding Zn-ribbon protein